MSKKNLLESRGKIILDDTKNPKMKMRKKHARNHDILSLIALLFLIIASGYALIFFPVFDTIWGVAFTVNLIFGIGIIIIYDWFSFRLLKIYEKGISLPGRFWWWNRLTGKVEYFVPFNHIKVAYHNRKSPKWTPQNNHFILILKDGRDISINEYCVSSLKTLGDIISKYGQIPIISNRIYEYRKGEILPIPEKVYLDNDGFTLVFMDEKMVFRWSDVWWFKKHLAINGGITINLRDGSRIKLVALHQDYKRHRKILKSLNIALRKSKS